MKVFLRSAVTRGAVGLYGFAVGAVVGVVIGRPLGLPGDLTVYKLFQEQGSAIAGVLAVGAAFYTIRAMRETASSEIAAANAQTRAAQRQTEAMLLLERRRVAQESLAFAEMVEVAAKIVLEDLANARLRIVDSQPPAFAAYLARTSFTRTGFGELRPGCVRLGGRLAEQFLHTDKAIEWLSSKVNTPEFIGVVENVADELALVDVAASALRDEALGGIARCKKLLVETIDRAGSSGAECDERGWHTGPFS